MKNDTYYDSKTVYKPKSEYICEVCGGTIKVGEQSDVHTFCNPEYYTTRTHSECTDVYLKGDYCNHCGSWYEHVGEDGFCDVCLLEKINEN